MRTINVLNSTITFLISVSPNYSMVVAFQSGYQVLFRLSRIRILLIVNYNNIYQFSYKSENCQQKQMGGCTSAKITRNQAIMQRPDHINGNFNSFNLAQNQHLNKPTNEEPHQSKQICKQQQNLMRQYKTKHPHIFNQVVELPNSKQQLSNYDRYPQKRHGLSQMREVQYNSLRRNRLKSLQLITENANRETTPPKSISYDEKLSAVNNVLTTNNPQLASKTNHQLSSTKKDLMFTDQPKLKQKTSKSLIVDQSNLEDNKKNYSFNNHKTVSFAKKIQEKEQRASLNNFSQIGLQYCMETKCWKNNNSHLKKITRINSRLQDKQLQYGNHQNFVGVNLDSFKIINIRYQSDVKDEAMSVSEKTDVVRSKALLNISPNNKLI